MAEKVNEEENGGWQEFWQRPDNIFAQIMKLSTQSFAERVDKLYNIQFGSVVLDFGCGPAYLADFFNDKISYTGVDLNETFLLDAKRKHPKFSFCRVDEFHSSQYKEKFDWIILLSVSQYLADTTALQNLIADLKISLKKDGVIILADVIDHQTARLDDLLSLFKQCVKKGKLHTFFKFFFNVLASNYRQLARNKSLLQVSADQMARIATDLSMQLEKAPRLTIHKTRSNYLLRNLS